MEKPEKEKGREKSFLVLGQAIYNTTVKSQPRRLTHCAKSHGRSLRDINNNNNDDHHYPIKVGNLVSPGLNYMLYWNIECLGGAFAVTNSLAVSTPSTMTLFLTNGVSPGHSLSDWSVTLITIVPSARDGVRTIVGY